MRLLNELAVSIQRVRLTKISTDYSTAKMNQEPSTHKPLKSSSTRKNPNLQYANKKT